MRKGKHLSGSKPASVIRTPLFFCSSANRCNALGKFTFSDYCIEFFPLLKRCEKCECFAVSCYRRRQTVDTPFRCLNFTGCSADPRFMGWSKIPKGNRDG